MVIMVSGSALRYRWLWCCDVGSMASWSVVYRDCRREISCESCSSDMFGFQVIYSTTCVGSPCAVAGQEFSAGSDSRTKPGFVFQKSTLFSSL